MSERKNSENLKWAWIAGLIAFGVIVLSLFGVKSEPTQSKALIPKMEAPLVAIETVEVTLYIADKSTEYLDPFPTELETQGSVENRVNDLLKRYFEEQIKSYPIYPENVIVREVFLYENRLVLSIDGSFRQKFWGGAWTELLAVTGLVNSITESFAEIENVTLLIDDQEEEVFVRHVDISKPLKKDISENFVLSDGDI